MKVRMKGAMRDGYQYVVLEESPAYWLVQSPDAVWQGMALPKRLYEPVPEPRWVDVTKHVTVDAHDARILSMGLIPDWVVHLPHGMRWRKVCDCDPMPSVAFIIEHKVEA